VVELVETYLSHFPNASLKSGKPFHTCSETNS